MLYCVARLKYRHRLISIADKHKETKSEYTSITLKEGENDISEINGVNFLVTSLIIRNLFIIPRATLP